MYTAFYTATQNCCEGHETRKSLVKHSVVLTKKKKKDLNDFQFIALM